MGEEIVDEGLSDIFDKDSIIGYNFHVHYKYLTRFNDKSGSIF